MREVIKRLILILAAMAGIIFDKFSVLRILHFVLLILIFLLFRWFNSFADLTIAVIVFLISFSTRYLFLFFSFIRNGVADALKKRFGEQKGFDIYQTLTALMFFTSGLSFTLLVVKSEPSIPFYQEYSYVFNIAGVILALAALIINVWSTWLVGIDVYYYKDMFIGRRIGEFRNEGPYNLFSNPMYGPGQANGYGTALIYGSFEGVIGMLMNQLMMYIFFYTIEKPHIIRILKVKGIVADELKKTG